MKRDSLPRKLEDLRGLSTRRYVRVSSEEQGWKYGPDGQNLTIDEAVSRASLQESGPAFLDEQSAWRNSDERPALRPLLVAARNGQYRVLVVAYFSRWSRDAEVALRIRRELHAAGVALFFADEGFLSTDEDAHERYLDEAVAAEKFSHRLSRTIKRTHAAKFERYGDQAGSPGMGFYRTPQPEARLAIDPETMPGVVALFERYARGDMSYRTLAREHGIAEGAIRAILTNPLYNGWAVRNRRSPDERRVAAPWREDPPVSDELWARVAQVRAERINRLIDELDEQPTLESGIDPDRAIEWLQDLKRSWEWADEAERANLVRAIYRRIVVEGDRFVGVELTEEAKANGLAEALPKSVALARPARAGRSATTLVRVPIHGRARWLASTRERSAS